MVFAAGSGKPSVMLAEIDSTKAIPVPSPFGEDGAFDCALARDGWVAVKIGYQVAAYRDGSLLDPVVLPSAWQMFPAAEPDAILLRLYPGRSQEPDEPSQVVVVDGSGAVRRSGVFPHDAGHGEVAGGVVGLTSIWSWSDQSRTPLDGWPIGTLDGRVILLSRPGEVEAIDLQSGLSRRCRIPAGEWRFHSGAYDMMASSFAASGRHGVLVADVSAGPRWIPLHYTSWRQPVWLADGTLLLPPATVVNVATGQTASLGLARRQWYPRLDVTGRFDAEQVRAVFRLPATPAERALTRSGTGQALAATAATRPYLSLAETGIRLRSCLPRETVPVGESRVGGQPDLPAGRRWPRRDGVPMAFLAQVRLDAIAMALADAPVPATGVLSVFAELEPDGMYPVDDKAVQAEIYPAAGLTRVSWPADLPQELRFDIAELLPEPLLTLPQSIPDVDEATQAEWHTLVEMSTPRGPDHRMLGHPAFIQCDPWRPADGHGTPMALLLQIDGDSIAGLSFGDGGRLHFWVLAGDLKAGDLRSCEISMESG